MKKNVVFIGTRCMYKHMVPPILSLIEHTKVDNIFLLIEDDVFPFDLPCDCTVINVSNQTFFAPDSINYNNYFGYICLMRVALTKILPDIDYVLSLDDDIIVTDDLSPIWDIDLTGKWLAAVPETFKWGVETDCYYNCGVVFYNLKQMREDGIDDLLLQYLNEEVVTFSDQVAINHFLATNQHKAVKMPLRFNEFCNSGSTDNPALVHFCGNKDWMIDSKQPRFSLLKHYQEEAKKIPLVQNLPMELMPTTGSIRYMIHACPQRMWFVQDFLIPAMRKQGIGLHEIYLWCDTEGWGNLQSFVKSMEFVRAFFPLGDSIWHIQDDVFPSSHFKAIADSINCLAYGFCNERFDSDNYDMPGHVRAHDSWHSFQCVCIPNRYARGFHEWFIDQTTNGFRLMPWTKSGNNDDMIFRMYNRETHPNDPCVNVRPNIVEHVDFIIGGSVLFGRQFSARSKYWEEPTLIENLQEAVEAYQKERENE